jgi:hypothetical protein
MENTEVQPGDKKKQLEFLKNVWKSSRSPAQTSNSDNNIQIENDELNIRGESTHNTQKDENSQPSNTREVFLNDDSLPAEIQSFPARNRARGDESDEDEIINDFFVKQTTTSDKRLGKTLPLPENSRLLIFFNPAAPKSQWEKGSEEGNSTPQRQPNEDYVSNDKEPISASNDAGPKSMFALSVSYRSYKHAGSKSNNETEFSNLPLSMDYGNVCTPFSEDLQISLLPVCKSARNDFFLCPSVHLSVNLPHVKSAV